MENILTRKQLTFSLISEEQKVLYSLDGILEYDSTNEYDEGEILFQHPFSGSFCESARQALSNWNEMDETEEEYRWKLVDLIEQDELLLTRAWDTEEGESINYYI